MPAPRSKKTAATVERRTRERPASDTENPHLRKEPVVQAREEILDLTTANVGIEHTERRGAAECSVRPTQPNARRLEPAECGCGDVRNVGNTIESIGLYRREQALLFATGESSGGNANDRTNVPDIAPEASCEHLQRRKRQTVANGFNEVRTLGHGAENLTAAEKICDT
jgi:hypothetical protein